MTLGASHLSHNGLQLGRSDFVNFSLNFISFGNCQFRNLLGTLIFSHKLPLLKRTFEILGWAAERQAGRAAVLLSASTSGVRFSPQDTSDLRSWSQLSKDRNSIPALNCCSSQGFLKEPILARKVCVTFIDNTLMWSADPPQQHAVGLPLLQTCPADFGLGLTHTSNSSAAPCTTESGILFCN